jgi:hypothetical protein
LGGRRRGNDQERHAPELKRRLREFLGAMFVDEAVKKRERANNTLPCFGPERGYYSGKA